MPGTKHRLVLTDTPPPHSLEQLLQLDHSVQKYCGSLAGLAGNGLDGLGDRPIRWLEAGGGRGFCCLIPGRSFARLTGSSIRRPSEPFVNSFVTSTALLLIDNEFTATHRPQNYLNVLVNRKQVLTLCHDSMSSVCDIQVLWSVRLFGTQNIKKTRKQFVVQPVGLFHEWA